MSYSKLNELSEKIQKHLPSLGTLGVYSVIRKNSIILEEYNLSIDYKKTKSGKKVFVINSFFNDKKIENEHIKTIPEHHIEDTLRFFLLCVAEIKIAKSIETTDE